MRLIFIPGFGETQRIFSQIAPQLPGEHVFVENSDLLGSQPMPSLTAIGYARMLVDKHHITSADWVIGHSMGGWIAYAIKHLTGCSIIQIASWTDPAKVVLPVKNSAIIHWLVRKGWYLNQFNKRLLLGLVYRNKPSAQIFGEVFQNLIDSPPTYVINQLRIILNPLGEQIDVQPEVIIHSKKDTIIRYPDNRVSTVSGDHFNLITHPDEVITAIRPFLTP
ncbi:alpha/beta fold hydrolase [Spirosoma spitsbergense]|uniref:alpha/beta fold hydrolase n=1 Tax=Spirosoma spitsbergense TaxID=431554 RepID=UPI000367F969|nr:alpha/beta hydrolase [Spirosoma spitsbergense]